MKIHATEITEIIKQQITAYNDTVDVAEVGTVIQAGDGIARVFGLENVGAGETLDFPHGVKGMALNLEEDNVGAVLFGEYEKISEGDTVRRTGTITSVPVGEALIGRVVNALGEPIVDDVDMHSDRRLPRRKVRHSAHRLEVTAARRARRRRRQVPDRRHRRHRRHR